MIARPTHTRPATTPAKARLEHVTAPLDWSGHTPSDEGGPKALVELRQTDGIKIALDVDTAAEIVAAREAAREQGVPFAQPIGVGIIEHRPEGRLPYEGEQHELHVPNGRNEVIVQALQFDQMRRIEVEVYINEVNVLTLTPDEAHALATHLLSSAFEAVAHQPTH
ncbi:hypothetical protein [Cellulosimicrobium composti]|uniref:hypothetical protein n=1 Tax=Cellulosimicrobium composti TaxID=2672572 RepID=UPI0037A914C6